MAPLNIIVDDSALVASVKSNATYSIVPWINSSSINVFVPLHALERLARLARIRCPVSNDAAKALRWLDQVTSWTEHKIAGRVKLQGPDDQYHTWSEVEQYLLPDTPLNDGNTERVDRLSKMLDQGMTLGGHKQKQSPDTSPVSATSSLSSTSSHGKTAQDESSTTLSAHGIPPQVRPLLNFTVWCTHHGDATSIAKGKYILVTNDYIIQKQAGKFGVRAKLLSQLQQVLGKAAPAASSAPVPVDVNFDDAMETSVIGDMLLDEPDEDEVVFDPSQRPSSSRGPAQASTNVMDPDHFGRDPTMQPRPTEHRERAERGERGRGRGSRGAHRSRGQGHRGRGGDNGTNANQSGRQNGSNAQNQHAPRGRGRGGRSSPPRGGSGGAGTASAPSAPPRQIDPDSFTRPAHMTRRGRGGAQRLWDPTTTTG